MKDKLHVCCGEVYLDGYYNIDAHIPGYSFIASHRPDIVKVNKTTLKKYYKYPFGTHPLKLCVADELVDILHADFRKDYFQEILLVSAFEHFSYSDARTLLIKFFQALKRGGRLLFDVPDVEASFKSIQEDRSIDNILWHIRLIYGSQKNSYGFHKWGYTKETLKDELGRTGFKKIEFRTIVPHDYPMLGVCAVKS